MTASGLLVLDKAAGMTSHDVVARVRRVLGTRKVGHAGTLDPMATGVLVVGVERATRMLGHLALHDKRYVASIRLGATTVTDDREGDVIEVAAPEAVALVDDDRLFAAVARLTGAIDQRPSSVSAVKVDGRRAYDRVRQGEEVDLPTRSVHVSRLDITGIERYPGSIDLAVDVECSTGTYVRALARDLGADLGIGGHLTSLRRTRVGTFEVAEAISLDQLERSGESALLGMSIAAARCFPVWTLDEQEAAAARFGQRVPWAGPVGVRGAVALMDRSGCLLGLGQDDDGTVRYLAVLA